MTAIDFASFVDQLATAAGETILPFFRTALTVENKKIGGFDPVTAADRAAEQTMRTLIRGAFPITASSGRNTAASVPTPNTSGCSTRSTAPNPSSPAWWPGAR